MSAHTPGPWFVGRMLSPEAPAIVGDGDSVVAMLPGDWNGCSYIKEDARLIAAAPELLEALELIASAKARGFGIEYAEGCARAAIAKARGDA